MDAEMEPLQAVRRAANTHWRAGAWYLKQLQAQRAATHDIRHLKSWKFREFAKNVRWMLMGAISDTDVLSNVLRQLNHEIAKADSKPPLTKHTAFPVDEPATKKGQA